MLQAVEHTPAHWPRFARSGSTLMLALALVSTACAPSSSAEKQQIVSVGGSITEIIYALGAQDRIVAVDTTSLYPPEALRTKPNVGYLRQLSAEGVLSRNPTLMIAAEGAGPADTLGLLKSAGLRIALLDEQPSARSVLDKIDEIGRLLDLQPQAQALSTKVSKEFEDLYARRKTIAKPLRVMVILGFQSGRAMAAGRKTAADAMIALAGGVNAAGAMDNYKQLSDEAIIEAAPDALVMAQRGDDDVLPANIFDQGAFAATPAAATHHLIQMNANYMLGFGPRTAQAAHELMSKLYPANPSTKSPAKP
jgi:iron complex transport system substrate-binding protein